MGVKKASPFHRQIPPVYNEGNTVYEKLSQKCGHAFCFIKIGDEFRLQNRRRGTLNKNIF
ncbi:MAG: hypothetical protein K0S25_261 [Bacillus sp. (in: firmicutes)]|jgi:hypothetical protein|nr:hypothetical protein [Bacillus sp. (in: firmicutes)]